MCSYCVVRIARGKSRSRKIADVLGEIEGLVANGYREIVLTGIHIGSFGAGRAGQENKLPELIESLRGIEGLLRVRLSSIDPNEIDERLVDAIRASPRMCRQLHVPIQSGSDAILRTMNRHYTRDSYARALALLREALPGVSITTDVMVGFPGETEEDFQRSRQAVSEAEFSKVHIFPFSSRPGTPADRLSGRLRPEVIKERIARLSRAAKAAALKVREKLRGQVVDVLVEREFFLPDEGNAPRALKNGLAAYEGFSSDYLRTAFRSDQRTIADLRNRIVHVRVEDFDDRYLYGRET